VRRTLIILMVCVLVIGGIGAALATGMDFTNVGALSLARHSVPPQVNADSLVYLNSEGSACIEGQLVVGVELSFDSDLKEGSQIHVALLDSLGILIDQGRTGERGLDSDLPNDSTVTIYMEEGNHPLNTIDQAKTEVTVLPSFVPGDMW